MPKPSKASSLRTTSPSPKIVERVIDIPANQTLPVADWTIPSEQWELPAGFSEDGQTLVTLKDVCDPHINTTVTLSQLSEDQRTELIAKRIERQPKFEISMVGIGSIDRVTAAKEVRAKTKVGQVLAEIEQRVINKMLAKAKNEETTRAEKAKDIY